MVVKKYIVADMKSVGSSAVRYFPAFCNAWNYLKIIIQLHKPVEHLIHCPDVLYSFCRSRVQRSYFARLVVTEELFSRFAPGRTARVKEKEKGKRQKAGKS